MVLLGLGGVFGVTLILLVHADVRQSLGLALLAAGVATGLASLSRHRYVEEARHGFEILGTRGGGFVLGSALALTVVALLVVLLVVGGQ
jgi:uncharacterized membrane protein YidH (DUF202 family)